MASVGYMQGWGGSSFLGQNANPLDLDKSCEEASAPPAWFFSWNALTSRVFGMTVGSGEDEKGGNLVEGSESKFGENEIKPTKNEINSTKKEINSTKTEIHSTETEIISTKNEINSTKNEINSAKNEINSTKNEINSTKNEINSTKNELNFTKIKSYSTRTDSAKGAIHSTNECKMRSGSVARNVGGDRQGSTYESSGGEGRRDITTQSGSSVSLLCSEISEPGKENRPIFSDEEVPREAPQNLAHRVPHFSNFRKSCYTNSGKKIRNPETNSPTEKDEDFSRGNCSKGDFLKKNVSKGDFLRENLFKEGAAFVSMKKFQVSGSLGSLAESEEPLETDEGFSEVGGEIREKGKIKRDSEMKDLPHMVKNYSEMVEHLATPRLGSESFQESECRDAPKLTWGHRIFRKFKGKKSPKEGASIDSQEETRAHRDIDPRQQKSRFPTDPQNDNRFHNGERYAQQYRPEKNQSHTNSRQTTEGEKRMVEIRGENRDKYRQNGERTPPNNRITRKLETNENLEDWENNRHSEQWIKNENSQKYDNNRNSQEMGTNSSSEKWENHRNSRRIEKNENLEEWGRNENPEKLGRHRNSPRVGKNENLEEWERNENSEILDRHRNSPRMERNENLEEWERNETLGKLDRHRDSRRMEKNESFEEWETNRNSERSENLERGNSEGSSSERVRSGGYLEGRSGRNMGRGGEDIRSGEIMRGSEESRELSASTKVLRQKRTLDLNGLLASMSEQESSEPLYNLCGEVRAEAERRRRLEKTLESDMLSRGAVSVHSEWGSGQVRSYDSLPCHRNSSGPGEYSKKSSVEERHSDRFSSLPRSEFADRSRMSSNCESGDPRSMYRQNSHGLRGSSGSHLDGKTEKLMREIQSENMDRGFFQGKVRDRIRSRLVIGNEGVCYRLASKQTTDLRDFLYVYNGGRLCQIFIRLDVPKLTFKFRKQKSLESIAYIRKQLAEFPNRDHYLVCKTHKLPSKGKYAAYNNQSQVAGLTPLYFTLKAP